MKKLNIAVIPARMGSSRFPGKPMADILGMPMIGHVYNRVALSNSIDEVYVATCDKVIFDYIVSIGGKAVMTSDSHERCSDRCAEAMLLIEEELKCIVNILVMVQGDEPLTFPEMLDESIAPLLTDEKVQISNLVAGIETVDEFADPNEVKVVLSQENKALYFSREPIPSVKKVGGKSLEQFKGQTIEQMLIALSTSSKDFTPYKQVCVIPFRRAFLLKYNEIIPTPLEDIESVDMSRIIENGGDVLMVHTDYKTKAVDTEADLLKVIELMKSDSLWESKYFS
jgi:3-deoxy-manno-octulosonate cytidylyltransferase (CMP-KDO synthetase)